MAQEKKKKLEHFYSLLDEYKQSVFPELTNIEDSPVKTLDLLQTVDQVKSIPDQLVVDVIVQGCKGISHEQNATLARSFCLFMYKKFTKQIRTGSFRSNQFDICINYLMDGIESAKRLANNNSVTSNIDCQYKVDLLRALSALLFDNMHHTQRSIKRLSSILLTLADPAQNSSVEVRRMAINCIGNLCATNTSVASTSTSSTNNNNATGSGNRIQPYFEELYACLLSNICEVRRTDQGTLMVTAATIDGAPLATLDLNDANVRKVASSTLRALSYLLLQDKSLVMNTLCDIVQIVHTFIFMHVNVQSYSISTASSIISSSTSATALKLSNLTKRVSKSSLASFSTISSNTRQSLYPSLWKPMHHYRSSSIVTSSESELSDATSNLELSPRRQRDLSKIRINALLCLSAIATVAPKELYPHWHKFLPDTFSIFLLNNSISAKRQNDKDNRDTAFTLSSTLKSDNQPYSLFTILLYDPNPHVQVAVCNTLMTFFQGSKQYLSLAVDESTNSNQKPSSSTSFTSLSTKLGSIVHDIFQAFYYVLSSTDPSNQQVLTWIMQAISVFIDNCTFDKLSKEYLPWMYTAILPYWKVNQSLKEKVTNMQQQQYQAAMLKAFKSIFSIYQYNLVEYIDRDFIRGNDSIIVVAMENRQYTNQEHVWQLCNTLTSVYYKECMPALWNLLEHRYLPKSPQEGKQAQQAVTVTTTESLFSSSSIKFLETYAVAMNEYNEPLDNQVIWWQKVLAGYLAKACSATSSEISVTEIQETATKIEAKSDKSIEKNGERREEQEIRSAACDCFAALSQEVFEGLSVRFQRLAITLLFSLAADMNKYVRAAAYRTLGIFILFPSLREDPLFVSEMIKSLLSQKDEKTVLIRVRASWAMANLCDALVLESEKEEFALREYMTITEWINIIDMATNGALDNEKLKSNSARSIGSLLRITPKEYFENTRIMSLVKRAIQALVKNIEGGSSLKVRWNACHATSNVLMNLQFPIGYQTDTRSVYPWTHMVFSSLMDALLNCKNYKVRINACLALSTPKLPEQYGDQLTSIVSAILKAWDRLLKDDEQGSFNEIKYKEQLKKQVAYFHFFFKAATSNFQFNA
ncbi:armadillo-type protein [Mycotypha africana]|uniref:armadillo-type protein n=1 Tax=Mycotypha africana TaxID=64632 RepID=UPI0023017E1D|nr:armadillo-type protein [Mycotypha africana]KAI8987688.1 armadillo-type protein [Mycotypha africana]